MRRSRLPLLPLMGAILLAFLVLPGSARAQSVRVNWSKRAPFSSYKTFAWLPSRGKNHPFYRQDIDNTTQSDLEAKGLHEVPMSQNPDLLVTYHFLVQHTVDQETYGFDNGGWGGWGWGWGGMGDGYDNMTTTNVPRTMGILTVDMIDAHNKKIVWRGQASESNIAKGNKGEEKQVSQSLHKMLQHFPPK